MDLFEPANWPRGTPGPRAELLRAARAVAGGLADLDERCVAIVGVGQRTVTAMERAGEEFVYAVSADGDGTVPARSATPAGVTCHFFRSEHSELLRSPTVARALLELIRHGSTATLQRTSALTHEAAVRVSDAELRRTFTTKIDWQALAPAARRLYLQQLNVPPPQYLRRARRRRSDSGSVNTP